MALSGFCTVCQRTVYIDADSTPICPVCSTPLLETVESVEENAPADAQEPVASGEK